MRGGSWLDMNGHAGQVMLPLLPTLASTDLLHRYICSGHWQDLITVL